ncbi:hypothetical protein BDF19DRAFT_432976 [Syncephalis fuscata]|nr:hypothetical protein BDF19DRAFT_432976 [Syncephalis fuscata]
MDSLDLTALRTALLVQYAFVQLKKQANIYQLYDGHFPSQSIIKNNLEFLAHHPDYLLCSIRYIALVTGADLARVLSDPGAASYYESRANQLKQTLV